MAPRLFLYRLRLCRYQSFGCTFQRFTSTSSASTDATPAILARVRTDLKTAMKARDTARLDALRGLLADVTNANKTSSPIKSDADMLSLIRKRVKNSVNAAKEAENAQRIDLAAKEQQQAEYLESYVADSGILSGEDVQSSVVEALAQLKATGGDLTKGSLLRLLLGPGGSLDGKLVDRKSVAEAVSQALKE